MHCATLTAYTSMRPSQIRSTCSTPPPSLWTSLRNRSGLPGSARLTPRYFPTLYQMAKSAYTSDKVADDITPHSESSFRHSACANNTNGGRRSDDDSCRSTYQVETRAVGMIVMIGNWVGAHLFELVSSKLSDLCGTRVLPSKSVAFLHLRVPHLRPTTAIECTLGRSLGIFISLFRVGHLVLWSKIIILPSIWLRIEDQRCWGSSGCWLPSRRLVQLPDSTHDFGW